MTTLKTYKSYNFTDKDPIIALVLDAIKKSGCSLDEIERRSGVVPSTIRNWEFGKTRRPLHSTVTAVLRAIGYDIQIVRRKG